jgi:Flp pilus assembly pilin Flp
MIRTLKQLHCDEGGQDLVEYALVISLVALGSITSMKSLSNYISNSFKTVGTNLTSVV